MNDTDKNPSEVPEKAEENPKRVRLTQEAASLITGQRMQDYGPPEVNFQRIADYWNIHNRTDVYTPRKVAEMLLLLKVARLFSTPTDDTYIDLIGYAAFGGEFAEAERKANRG